MKREAVLTFNIGLENNPLRAEQVWKHIKQVGLFDEHQFIHAIKDSTYQGETERTFVAEGYTAFKFSKVVEITEHLCVMMNQECIALTYNQNKVLLYNPTTKVVPEEQLEYSNDVYITL